jgi:hypothetical protein
MAEHHGLSGAPVVVIDLCAVFGREGAYGVLFFVGSLKQMLELEKEPILIVTYCRLVLF